jgi:hypothetical protein
MDKLIKLMVVLALAVGMGGMAVGVYAQEIAKQSTVSSLSGEIVSVDVVKSTVVIKQLKDPVTNTYEDVTLSVSSGTKITKAAATLQLSELKAGDKVKVEYSTDSLGTKKVESISVEAK